MDGDTGKLHLRCAKRSSASLKTAIASEEAMGCFRAECTGCDYPRLCKMLRGDAADLGSGASSRARRDAKCALEQRKVTVACGNEPMLSIDLVGRAVRLWNEWYALCSHCGCFVRFKPSNRYGSEICCLRCDYKLLNRHSNASSAHEQTARAPQCRYCGKVRKMLPPRARRRTDPRVCVLRWTHNAPEPGGSS